MSIYNINQAMGMIDADLIEAAVYPPESEREKAKPTAFKPWMKYAVAAVVIAVFAIGTPVALNMAGVFGTNNVVDPASSGSGSGSDVSEVIYPPEDDSHSTVSEPPQPIVPASPGSYEEPDPDLPHGGDNVRLTNYMYLDDRLTSFDTIWDKYITEQAGEDLFTLWKAEWRTEQGSAFSLIEIVEELNIPKEKFVELNNKKLKEIRAANYFTEDVIFSDFCFTDDEIEIIYSGDKKRIAEAFANPYAVIADDWEIYPLRWIINNPASVYNEKHISLSALETAVNKLLNEGYYPFESDRDALLARVEEYKNMQ